MGFFKKIFSALKKTKDVLSQKLTALFARDKIGEEFYEDLKNTAIEMEVIIKDKRAIFLQTHLTS